VVAKNAKQKSPLKLMEARSIRAIVVGSGAGGATAARELAKRGFEVLILEAGHPFNPLSHRISWLSPLRGSLLLKNEHSIERIFPHMETTRSSEDIVIFRGVTEGGSTVISCGNMVRAERGLKEIGLDLTPEYEEIEHSLEINPVPKEKWRPLSQRMFDEANRLGLSPKLTPKVVNQKKCVACGFCELGCASGAKWDSRILFKDIIEKGGSVQTDSPVRKILVEGGKAKGVLVSQGSSLERIEADLVVLAAGGVGTAQILKTSDLPARDKLWVDIVLTVGGISKNSEMLKEPPMVWFVKQEHNIISPYFDLLSFWFHKPWRDVPLENRVGMMIKLSDTEEGSVDAQGTITKRLTELDRKRLEEAKLSVRRIMEASGVNGPFVDGMLHGGHLGGTVPLTKEDVETMHPSWLPQNLWVADLSLMPRSQGLPTMLTTAGLALRVAKRIAEEKGPK
jgi:choline dehydrogenase-like flavoprotein